MTEWGVVGVIIALAGLASTVLVPALRLNASITKLTVTVQQLVRDMEDQRERSHEAHKRLWDKNDEQDKTLNDHETRITTLERK